MERRFTASGVAYAEQSLTRVARRLDAWQEAWVAEHRRTCEADRAAQDTDVHFACLQRQLAEVRALSDVLATADAAVVESATRATADLPDLRRCDADPEAADEGEHEAWSVLEHAKAMHRAGRYDDALRSGRKAVAEAATPALRARALYTVGAAHYRLAQYDDALHSLDAAVWLAAEAGLDGLAARAATLLVPTVGKRLDRPDDGLQWARHAEAFLARGNADALARARLLNNVGQVHDARGALPEALASYGEALRLKVELPPDHPALATTLLNLGTVHGKLGQLDEAEADLQESLEIFERAHGPDHPAVADPLTNLGNVARARGEPKAAVAAYRRAVQIREAAGSPTSPTLATPLSNLGVVLSSIGEHAEAEAIHGRVVRLFEEAHGRDHSRTASAYVNRGDAAFRQGKLAAAERDFMTAAGILGRVAPKSRAHVTALLDLGEVRLAAERWEHARTTYVEVWALAKAVKAPPVVSAKAAVGLGRALVELQRGEDALPPLQWARARLREAGDPAEPVKRTEALLARAASVRHSRPRQ